MKEFWTSVSTKRRAIILVVLSTMGFSLSHALIRQVSSEVSPIQTVFFHNFFGFFLLLPWFAKSGRDQLRTSQFLKHLLRAVLNISAMFTFFMALSLIPLAKVTALFFTAPIFAVILSSLILGERARLRRWSAVICGFIGVLIILRPGLQTMDLGSILVLTSALLWAGTVIVIKILGRTDTAMTSTAYMSLLMAILAIPPALLVWETPPLHIWPYLLLMAGFGTFSMLAITQALREADASALMPYDFLKLVWASILAYILFDQRLDIFIWIGGIIVFISTFYLAYRESISAKQATPKPNSQKS